MSRPVLRVRGLTVDYRVPGGDVRVVRDVEFDLFRGRILGLAGESGSGKSTAALAAIGWTDAQLRRVGGESTLDDTDLCALRPDEVRRFWGRRVGYVPQEIGGALHPSFRIRSQFRETLRVNASLSNLEADERSVRLLESVNIAQPQAALRRYPHEFSGGQLQRIAVALALAPGPDVLVLDEPTTGLDVNSQQLVANVLRQIIGTLDVAALFISHDLALMAEIADDIAIMYAGEIVEAGPARVLRQPRHPYTRALLNAVPSPREALVTEGIAGTPPGRVIEGRCGFAARCGHAVDVCRAAVPPLEAVEPDHLVRCVRSRELRLVANARARTPALTDDRPALLEVVDLTCGYRTRAGTTTVVSGVSLRVQAGSVTALVGESGSGKSTLGRAVAGILEPLAGQIRLAGVALPSVPRRRTTEQRHHIQLVFQNPGAALNPRRTVGDHLRHITARFVDADRVTRLAAVAEMLDAVQLDRVVLERYPHQLSGGQRQRVAIAAAFVARPRVVVCDEITSGQDVSVQAAILATLADLQRRFGTSVLFIAHDLGVVRSIADHVYVMRDGRIVESGASETVFVTPEHPYTHSLLDAVPVLPRPGPVNDPATIYEGPHS
jgi:peptide/nickel transport system ATP-binding protein